jgi:hypothetical protein
MYLMVDEQGGKETSDTVYVLVIAFSGFLND